MREVGRRQEDGVAGRAERLLDESVALALGELGAIRAELEAVTRRLDRLESLVRLLGGERPARSPGLADDLRPPPSTRVW